MSNNANLRSYYRPFLELLETRQAPSVTPWAVENFDSTTVGQIPTNWSQWASDGSLHWSVENTNYQSSPNGIQSSQGSSVTSRAWLNNVVLSDVDVTASYDVRSLNLAQIIARGTNLASSMANYYAVQIVSGMTVKLVKVTNGTQADLSGTNASVTTVNYFSGFWVQVTLDVNNANTQNILPVRPIPSCIAC